MQSLGEVWVENKGMKAHTEAVDKAHTENVGRTVMSYDGNELYCHRIAFQGYTNFPGHKYARLLGFVYEDDRIRVE